MTVRLWKPSDRNEQNKKNENESHEARFGDGCVEQHAKSPNLVVVNSKGSLSKDYLHPDDHAKQRNLVIVSVDRFIYFQRKIGKPFDRWKETSVMKSNLIVLLVNHYSPKPSFTLEIVPRKPFCETPDGHDGRRFRRRGSGKTLFC